MAALRLVFLLALAMLCSVPALAEPDKSLFASIEAKNADGSPLLGLVLAGECDFAPEPVCRVTLKDTAIHTQFLSGEATGTAIVELAPETLVLRALDLRMKEALLRLADDHEASVDLHLQGSGEYVPETGALSLSKVSLVTSGGLRLSGRLESSPESFHARLGVNLHQPAKLVKLLGPLLSDGAKASLPSGPVVLDLTASGDGDSFGPAGVNILTTAKLRKKTTFGAKGGEGGVSIPAMQLKARIRTDQPHAPLVARFHLPGGTLDANLDMADDGTGTASLHSSALDLSELGSMAQDISGLPLADWGTTGSVRLDSDLRFLADGISGDTRIAIGKLTYMSPMADYMGQDVHGDLHLKTKLDFESGHRAVSGKLAVPGGEMLFGSAYVNLTENPLTLDVNAHQLGPKRFRDLKADLKWQGYGRVRASGDLEAEGRPDQWKYKAGLAATDMDLERWWDTAADALALENFQGEHGLTGTAWLTLKLRADGKEADCEGRFTVNDGALTAADDSIEVRGADLELPIAYRLVGPVINLSPQYVDAKDWGELRAELVRAPFVEMRDSASRLALVPNRFFLRDPLTLSVLGGSARLVGIQVDRPFSSEFEVKLGAALHDLDLARSTRGAFPLEGALHGNLGTITLNRSRLDVPGALTGTFFGGGMTIDSLFGENPLAAHRKLGVSVSVREMDLERLSEAMDVGRVTGLMDLDIRDVVIAYGEPVSMLLRAETSGDGDFDRTVSLKAVNSLSVIGTGSGMGDVGVGMFASFFEEFSYDRIGFQCTLNNDIFRVRGLVHDGDVEYLIKKPWLTGINVVNSNPENYISFKDMLERVQRVVGKDDE